MLALLAAHPNFGFNRELSDIQARAIIEAMVDDLVEFEARDIEVAIRAYRQNPKARFFPSSGPLRSVAAAERQERQKSAKTKKKRLEFTESRPIGWWMHPKNLWKPDWRESEVPVGERIRDAPGGHLRSAAGREIF